MSLLSASVAAQTPKTKVAVFDLKAVGEVTSDQIGVLVDRILVKLGETKKYTTISRADLNALIGQEKLKDALGCTDTSCLAEIGDARVAERSIGWRLDNVDEIDPVDWLVL